nr:ATP synthase F0 subunit 9, mitochondrial [Tanacetum cinerariifolium]
MLTITDPTTTAPAEAIVAAEVAKLPIRYRRKSITSAVIFPDLLLRDRGRKSFEFAMHYPVQPQSPFRPECSVEKQRIFPASELFKTNRIDVMEGLKVIGVGTTTIALAGAVVGIGKIFSSLIHLVARNLIRILRFTTVSSLPHKPQTPFRPECSIEKQRIFPASELFRTNMIVTMLTITDPMTTAPAEAIVAVELKELCHKFIRTAICRASIASSPLVRYQAYSLEGDRWPQTCKSQLFVHIQAFVPHVRASRISTYCYTVRAPQSHLTRFQESEWTKPSSQGERSDVRRASEAFSSGTAAVDDLAGADLHSLSFFEPFDIIWLGLAGINNEKKTTKWKQQLTMALGGPRQRPRRRGDRSNRFTDSQGASGPT